MTDNFTEILIVLPIEESFLFVNMLQLQNMLV